MCLQIPDSKHVCFCGKARFTSLGVWMTMNGGIGGSCVPPVVNVPKCSPVNLWSFSGLTGLLTGCLHPSWEIKPDYWVLYEYKWLLTRLLSQQSIPPTTDLRNTLLHEHATNETYKKGVEYFTKAKVNWNHHIIIVPLTLRSHRAGTCLQLSPVAQWHVVLGPRTPTYRKHLSGSHEAANHIPEKLQQRQPAAMWRPSGAEQRWHNSLYRVYRVSWSLLDLCLFSCRPVSWIIWKMLITLFFSLLVSSVIATEKGKLI